MSEKPMEWGEALQAMKDGFRVTRQNWSQGAGQIVRKRSSGA